MIIDLDAFKDKLAADPECFGMTPAEAHAQGICISCKQQPDLTLHTTSAVLKKCMEAFIAIEGLRILPELRGQGDEAEMHVNKLIWDAKTLINIAVDDPEYKKSALCDTCYDKICGEEE